MFGESGIVVGCSRIITEIDETKAGLAPLNGADLLVCTTHILNWHGSDVVAHRRLLVLLQQSQKHGVPKHWLLLGISQQLQL